MNPKTFLTFLLPGLMVVFLLARGLGGSASAQTPVPTTTATPGPTAITLTSSQSALSCAASTTVTVNVTQGGTAAPNGTVVTLAANPGTVVPASLTTTNGAAVFTYFSPASGTGSATLTAAALGGSGTAQIALFCGAGPGPGPSPQIPGARLNTPTVQCFGNSANVIFSWQPVAGSEVQYVDLSLANNGFAAGTFIGFGPLAGITNTIQWNGLVAGQTHYYRVSAGVTNVGWAFSTTGVFTPCGPTAPPGGTSYVCTGGGRASVTWGINAPFGATATYVDITLQDNGFLPGTFIGQNATGQQNFTWTGILAQATHFWRINHLTPQGWVSGGVGSFFAAC